MDFTQKYQCFLPQLCEKGKTMNDLVIRTENLTKVYGEPIDFIAPMQPAFYNGKSRTHGNGGELRRKRDD